MVHGKSVLVVDDEPEMRESLTLAVAAAGGRALTAASGREAISLLERSVPDLAVVDIFMPDGDGLETIIEIRRRWPRVKLIAMSGGGRFGAHDILDVAWTLGVDLTLTKPFKLPHFVAQVERLLGAGDEP